MNGILMLEPVTGNSIGKQYMTRIKKKNNTVTAFAIQPSGPSRIYLCGGRTELDRLCQSSRAAGRAKLHCCRTSAVPMNALKAVEEPR